MARRTSNSQVALLPALTLFVLLAVVLVFTIVSTTNKQQSPSAGTLIFTDMNPGYSVYRINLEDFAVENLARDCSREFACVTAIDENHSYVDACFGWKENSMFCSTYVSDLFTENSVDNLEVIKTFWKVEYGSPILSPDNSYIAFAEAIQSTPLFEFNIQLMKSDGSNIHDPIPGDSHDGYSLAWSPDSTLLAFACTNGSEICIANVHTNTVQVIKPDLDSEIRDLAWSPDGRQIAFRRLKLEPYISEIYIINTDGSNLRNVSGNESLRAQSPVWSPDSNYIAFRSSEPSSSQIQVVKADGTELHSPTENAGYSNNIPVWSPDSSQIAFFAHYHDENIYQTYLSIVDRDGKNLRKLAENHMWQITDVGPPALFWLP